MASIESNNNQSNPSVDNNATQSPHQQGNDDLPPQHHAGKVGFGPYYHAGPTIDEKISGLKEELKGKVRKNPDQVKHGHDLLTGEEKRKKMNGDGEANPFQKADEEKDEDSEQSKPSGPAGHSLSQSNSHQSDERRAQEISNSGASNRDNTQGVAMNQGYGKGAKEQAATVAPEGTQDASVQRQGGAVDRVKNI